MPKINFKNIKDNNELDDLQRTYALALKYRIINNVNHQCDETKEIKQHIIKNIKLTIEARTIFLLLRTTSVRQTVTRPPGNKIECAVA